MVQNLLMQSWITMNDNHLSNILDIKNYRKSFIESFDTNDIEIKNKLINATNDINLQSIRIHKLITHNSNIGKVLFADIMISFDNVIGVVAAAKGYFGFMIFGLMLSVVLTGALATYMANYIQRHIWIAYIGLVFILIVGLQLVIGGLVDLEILNINEEFKKYF